MLAAASNYGGNQRPSWPARHDQVMCIHATTGLSNKYPKNPTPLKNKDNFAVLGSSAKAAWPSTASGTSPWIRKSGTSTAAPVAASIAGIVLTCLKTSKLGYLDKIQLDEAAKEEEGRRYQRKLQVLGRPKNMAAVFRLMVGEEGERDDYHYVVPWRVFRSDYKSPTYMIENILSKIDV